MNTFELYDKVNRKTWIFQVIVVIVFVFIVYTKKYNYIDSENNYYVLLFATILIIKILLFIICFIITRIKK